MPYSSLLRKVTLTLLCLLSIFTAKASQSEACSNTFEVVTEFRYVLSVAGSQLSVDQQKLAEEFLELLSLERGPVIQCETLEFSQDQVGYNKLTLTLADRSVSGTMTFDSVGEIEDFFFENLSSNN